MQKTRMAIRMVRLTSDARCMRASFSIIECNFKLSSRLGLGWTTRLQLLGVIDLLLTTPRSRRRATTTRPLRSTGVHPYDQTWMHSLYKSLPLGRASILWVPHNRRRRVEKKGRWRDVSLTEGSDAAGTSKGIVRGAGAMGQNFKENR